MSAPPFTIADSNPADFWPSSTVDSVTVGGAVRHLIDFNHFFGNDARRWPDALTSEARRHLAGCLNTVETAMTLLTRDTKIGRLLGGLESSPSWSSVQRMPFILSPELMAHMRLRAAISLLGGQSVRVDGDPSADAVSGTGLLIGDADPEIADMAANLLLADARWSARDAGVRTMQADLPAEHFAELVWTTAAVLGTELYRAGLVEQNAAMTAMATAAYALLARHNEGAGPFALAKRLARSLCHQNRHAELLGQALGERRYLLFAALAGEVTRIEMETVLDVLVHGSDAQLAALCKALGGTAFDYRHLLVDLRIVRGERDDPTLVRLAARYDDLRDEDAMAQADMLRCPPPLRAKLALIPAVRAA